MRPKLDLVKRVRIEVIDPGLLFGLLLGAAATLLDLPLVAAVPLGLAPLDLIVVDALTVVGRRRPLEIVLVVEVRYRVVAAFEGVQEARRAWCAPHRRLELLVHTPVTASRVVRRGEAELVIRVRLQIFHYVAALIA